MKKKVNNLLQEVVQLVYFMRGSIQYDAMMHMTPAERSIVQEFVRERLDNEAKKPPAQNY